MHPPPAPPSPDTEPEPEPTPSLLLWVFTPDLVVSSSLNTRGPTRAMKVFWKRETWAPLQAGEVEKADEEEVEVVGALFERLERALVESQGGMPGSARRWGDWEVGLLERFDGLGGMGVLGDAGKQVE